ncbi:MAG TPA: YihY/virulence factor BrkB family protein [Kineosporiaceae bacterium]|nr:YihY/virulence factor BrkB family protein [Kineosporiaceae bacterium]
MSRKTDDDETRDARSQAPDQKSQVPDQDPPSSPSKLPKRSWFRILRGAGKEFSDDNLSDSAAALTYYAIQSIFPGAIVLLSLVGFLGPQATQTLINNLGEIIPGSAQATIVNTIKQLQGNQQAASLAFIISLALGIWSASGYVAAFMRASNVVYDVPEGRPIWKTIPIRIAITVVQLVLMLVVAVIVVFTGPVAEQAGDLLGLGSAAVTTWNIVKWPVLLVIMMVMVGILYWAAPNAKRGFRWVTPGGVLGVLIWVIASALFAYYVANFASYNKTYGALAGVIIFLVWIWISNLAILLGAEFNAEIERARAETDGLPVGAEPYVTPRDTRKMDEDEKAEVEGSRRHLKPQRGGDAGSAGKSE